MHVLAFVDHVDHLVGRIELFALDQTVEQFLAVGETLGGVGQRGHGVEHRGLGAAGQARVDPVGARQLGHDRGVGGKVVARGGAAAVEGGQILFVEVQHVRRSPLVDVVVPEVQVPALAQAGDVAAARELLQRLLLHAQVFGGFGKVEHSEGHG